MGAGWRASAAGGNAKSGAAVSGCGVSRHPRLGHAWGTSDSRSCSCGNPVFPQLAGCTRPNHPQRPPDSMSLQGSLASMTCFGPRNPPQDDPGFGVRLDEEMPWAMTGAILRRGPVLTSRIPPISRIPLPSSRVPVVILGWGDWSRFRHRQRRYCRWGAPPGNASTSIHEMNYGRQSRRVPSSNQCPGCPQDRVVPPG